MKLVRWGGKGIGRPGAIDREGRVHDLRPGVAGPGEQRQRVTDTPRTEAP